MNYSKSKTTWKHYLIVAGFSLTQSIVASADSGVFNDCQYAGESKEMCYKMVMASEYGGEIDCIECLMYEQPEQNKLAETLGVVAGPLAFLGASYFGAKYQYKGQQAWADAYESGHTACTTRFNSYLDYSTERGATPISAGDAESFASSCGAGGTLGIGGGYAGYGGSYGNGYGGFGNSFASAGYSPGFMGGMMGPNFSTGISGGFGGGSIGFGGGLGLGLGMGAMNGLFGSGSGLSGGISGGINIGLGTGMGGGMYPGGYGMGGNPYGGIYGGMSGGFGYPGMGGGIYGSGLGMGAGISGGVNLGLGNPYGSGMYGNGMGISGYPGGVSGGVNFGAGNPYTSGMYGNGMYGNGMYNNGMGGIYGAGTMPGSIGVNPWGAGGATGSYWNNSGGWNGGITNNTQYQQQYQQAADVQGQVQAGYARSQGNQVTSQAATSALYENYQNASQDLYSNAYYGGGNTINPYANGSMYSAGNLGFNFGVNTGGYVY